MTLLELLVVMAVVSMLASLLLPALSHARQVARDMTCLSNQRQLLLATAGYQHDYDFCFPQPAQDEDIPSVQVRMRALWYNALDDYFQLPRRSGAPGDRNEVPYKQDPIWLSLSPAEQSVSRTIKMNEFLGRISSESPLGVRFFRTGDVKQPARTVVYVDGRGPDTPSLTTGNIDADEFSATEVYVGLRHNQGANVAHADGHAAHVQQPIRYTHTGYRGWFNGVNGPQELTWRLE
ncbi:MAG TPA: DUF1559 domain-containing protein [Phycisphaeraceae bacterium]